MSDQVRDTIAETIGDILVATLFTVPGMLVMAGVVVIGAVGFLLTGFPLKKHKWCGGKGHWGIGPFRRKCKTCSGSGLVKR